MATSRNMYGPASSRPKSNGAPAAIEIRPGRTYEHQDGKDCQVDSAERKKGGGSTYARGERICGWIVHGLNRRGLSVPFLRDSRSVLHSTRHSVPGFPVSPLRG
jgi:hypothetical protein